jgi:hypothetical protein
MTDLIPIELYRDERWLPWDFAALRAGDMYRLLDGPNAGMVLKATSDAPECDCCATALLVLN